MTQTLALPRFEDATVVVPAPGHEPGNWSGAASAVLVDGVYWLTYRVRRPLREGRGVSVVVARSDDGEHFVTVAEVRRDDFGAESFERPVLVRRARRRLAALRLLRDARTPSTGGSRRSTPTSRPPSGRAPGPSCCPGSADVAVKDPVVLVDEIRLADVGLRPPADRAGPRGPDDHGLRDQRRRAHLGLARHRARPHRRHAGTSAAPGSPRCSPRSPSSSCTTDARAPRTTGTRSPGWPAPPTAARSSPRTCR